LRKSGSTERSAGSAVAKDAVATLLAEIGRLALLAAPERELAVRGYRLIAGVDEVGRGCLAGPVVAASVVLPSGFWWPGIDDSKKLEAGEREALAEIIRRCAVACAVATVSTAEVDALGIGGASLAAMRRSLEDLSPQPEVVLTDAFRVPGYARPQVPMIKGDARSISIAAASIVAKVHRDALMDDLARKFPAYGFDRHKGYAVAEHREAIARFGPCPEHRLSFHGVVAGTGES
jgi:ribonuclease HII